MRAVNARKRATTVLDQDGLSCSNRRLMVFTGQNLLRDASQDATGRADTLFPLVILGCRIAAALRALYRNVFPTEWSPRSAGI